MEWDKRTLLAFEKEILKMFVSDHPLRPYEGYLSQVVKYNMAALSERETGVKGTFAGMISEVTIRRTKRGSLMANFILEDTTGHCECVCFDYEKYQDAIMEDSIVTIQGRFEVSDRGNQILASKVERLELTEDKMNMEIQIDSNELNAVTSSKLMDILKNYPGNDAVIMYVLKANGQRMRAELPVTIDARNSVMKAHLHELFGRSVWKAS